MTDEFGIKHNPVAAFPDSPTHSFKIKVVNILFFWQPPTNPDLILLAISRCSTSSQALADYSPHIIYVNNNYFLIHLNKNLIKPSVGKS